MNHEILAGLDLGGQVLLLNKDRLSTLFKAYSIKPMQEMHLQTSGGHVESAAYVHSRVFL